MIRLLAALRDVVAPRETPIAPRSGVIGGLILLVSAAMTFIAVIAFEAALGADRIAGRWTSELAQSATVRISAAPEDLEAVTRAALGALEIAPGVASARRLSEGELQALLAPWLGRGADVSALPLPALVDVTLTGTGPDPEDLQRQLDLVAPGAVYDDHGEWRAPLIEAARGLRLVAFVGVGLTLVVLAAMVGVAAAASFWSCAGIVKTLRLIGAEDKFISRAFERQFALRAAIGGVFGALAALIVTARAPQIVIADILDAAAGEAETINLWLIFAAPVLCALMAVLATRGAGLIVLRRAT